MAWLKKLIIEWLLNGWVKKALALLLAVTDGKKRYLAIIIFIMMQIASVLSDIGQAEAAITLIAIIDALKDSVGNPTAADFGAYGFILIALFDALKKWALADFGKAQEK